MLHKKQWDLALNPIHQCYLELLSQLIEALKQILIKWSKIGNPRLLKLKLIKDKPLSQCYISWAYYLRQSLAEVLVWGTDHLVTKLANQQDLRLILFPNSESDNAIKLKPTFNLTVYNNQFAKPAFSSRILIIIIVCIQIPRSIWLTDAWPIVRLHCPPHLCTTVLVSYPATHNLSSIS